MDFEAIQRDGCAKHPADFLLRHRRMRAERRHDVNLRGGGEFRVEQLRQHSGVGLIARDIRRQQQHFARGFPLCGVDLLQYLADMRLRSLTFDNGRRAAMLKNGCHVLRSLEMPVSLSARRFAGQDRFGDAQAV